MKICTWNVNSLNVRQDHVCDWISSTAPDVVCLQETKMVDEKFPASRFDELEYSSHHSGQKTYNGVAVISKAVPEDVVTDFPEYEDPQRRLLAATVNGVRVINVYIPNGSEVGSEKYRYKLEWLEHLVKFLENELQSHQYVVLTGDYNIAPADEDVHDPKEWEGKILCSDREREMFQRMIGCGMSDTFRQFDQPSKSFSWWDYRQAAFRRDLGLRIDHILASEALAEKCVSCEIDKEPRSWERPSDHTPVVGTFEL